MRRWNIRIRLTLLFTALLVGLFLGSGAIVYWLFSAELLESVDQNLRDKVEALAAAYEFRNGRMDVELHEHSKGTLWLDSIAQITTPNGEVLFQNRTGPTVVLPLAAAAPLQVGQVQFSNKKLPGEGEIRIAEAFDQRYGRLVRVVVARSLEGFRGEQLELLQVMAFVGSLTALASTILGWLVIGRVLRPLAAMSAKVRQITSERLNDRLEIHNPHDEIGRLAATLNGMVERLEASFQRMRQFTTDASHELRTPLTCMRSEIEVALQQARTPSEYRDILGSVLEEIERLTRLSDALLQLARLDRGHYALRREAVDLAELLTSSADRVRVQAEAKGASLTVQAPPVVHVSGDRHLLEQVLLNLLDNAIKYGGREIQLNATLRDGTVTLRVHDSGPGITAEHVPHVFERFYRVDKSRSRELGGTGLGLSVVKQFVELHGGRVAVRSAPGDGTTFEVVLPRGGGSTKRNEGSIAAVTKNGTARS